jgi:hypothetical protein
MNTDHIAEDDIDESTEEPSQTLSPIEVRKAHERLMVEQTKKQLLAALAAHVGAATQQSWTGGWDQGFSDGWEAANKYFREQAEKEWAVRTAEQYIPYPSAQTSTFNNIIASSWHGHNHLDVHPYLHNLSSETRDPTANALVLIYITENPGQRGVEIATAFVGRLPERTVRTALHRLKGAGKIRNVDGRWYTPEATPADPLEELTGGGSDAAP